MATSLIPVSKSKLDDRDFSFFTLENKIDVVLVSDPQTDIAACAVGVGVGSFSDDVKALGMFHFLEHLLFMGTEKFPDESEYSNYISSHGGSNNAYTAATETVYYFDVNHAALEGAIDRFSQFFISPLFDASCTERELNAVHSEHDKNIYNDSWRQYELFRAVSHDENPCSKFHTGNLETLRDTPIANGTNVRDLILEGYKKFYSSNLMKLVIVGKEPITTLRDMAIKYFTPIKNYNVPAPTFSSNVLRDKGYVLETCPVKQRRSLQINWVISSDIDYAETAPLSILSHCIGDEGPKSLLSLLKAHRYAVSLSSGRSRRLQCISTFGVDIGLTEYGLLHIPDVLRIVFAYISTLQDKTDAEWLRLCTEAQLIDYNNFHYMREKVNSSDICISLVENMFVFKKPEHIVEADNIYHEINIPHIRQFLKEFDFEHSFFIISSPDVVRDVTFGCTTLMDSNIDYAEFSTKNPIITEFATEEMSCDELNTKYTTKQFSYDKYYKNRYAKYPLPQNAIEIIKKGLIPTDLTIAQKNEPLSYAQYTNVNEILDLPCPNPFVPHLFDILTPQDANADETTTMDAKSTYFHNQDVKSLPLTLSTPTDTISTSQLNLSYYNCAATTNLQQLPPQNINEFKTLITQLVNDNLIGFDSNHINTGFGTDAKISNKDEITADVIETIFGRTDKEFGHKLPPTPPAPQATPKQTEAEMNPEGDNEDEDHGDEDDEDDENGADDDESTPTSTTLFTVDSFFNDKDNASIIQFIPPQNISIPIPTSHFTITNQRKQLSIKPQSTPILPPIECFYKFTDSYNSSNVDIRCKIQTPGIDQIFLALYSRALTDILTEKLYPATLAAVNYTINEGFQAIDITVFGHRQTAAETFLTIIDNIFNPLICTEDVLHRQIDKYQRALSSISKSMAYQQAQAYLSPAMNRNSLLFSHKLDQLREIQTNLKQFASTDYLRRFVKNATFNVVGNVTQAYAIRLAQSTVLQLNLCEVLLSDIIESQPNPIQWGQGNTIGLVPNGNPLDNQGSLFNFYLTLAPFRTEFLRTSHLLKLKSNGLYTSPMVENENGESVLDMDLIESGRIFDKMSFYGNILYNFFISHIMSDHCFAILRTQQALGYIVASQNHYSLAGYGIAVIVQSETNTATVDQRIEHYMRKDLKDYLSSDEKSIPNHQAFVTNLIGAQTGLLQRFSNLQSEAQFFATPTLNRTYDWYRPLVLALLLPYLHRHVLLSYFNKWFLDLTQRRKFAIHITANAANTPQNLEQYQAVQSQDVLTYDEILGLKSLFPSTTM